MDYLKPLTPAFRIQIDNGIEELIADLNTCQQNGIVTMQKQSLETLKEIIGKLPDGYLMPMKRGG